MMEATTFNNAIQGTLEDVMKNDPAVMLLGLGITDPKGFFNTTTDLINKFGPERVLECPTSENAYLGHALGLSLGGYRPVVHFQRMDFMLYAFDQLINNAAKWKSMFNYSGPIPMVIRSLIGMGWGQGAQHSQNFSSLFTQVPGLKVVAPTCPQSASVILKKSLYDNDPTVFVEHRWLQSLTQKTTAFENSRFCDGKALIRKKGNLLTVITWSYSTAEALRFSELYPDFDIEIIDLLYLSPIDFDTILKSADKTNKILFWEPCTSKAGLSLEIITHLLKAKQGYEFYHLSHQFAYPASSPLLNLEYYNSLEKILETFNQILKINLPVSSSARWPVDKDLADWSPWG